MKKQTLLYILLVFLIISNGFFLIRYLGKPDRKGHKPESFIVKELNFDEKQMAEFHAISDLHKDNMHSIFKNIKDLKKEMFSKISDEAVPQASLDSITGLIAVQEKQKDLEIFKHLQKVRKICNEKQKERFAKIVGDAMERRGRRGRHKKR